jgi:hypothetical protein
VSIERIYDMKTSSAEVFALAEKVGVSRDVADKLMYEEGIIRAAEILAEKLAKLEARKRDHVYALAEQAKLERSFADVLIDAGGIERAVAALEPIVRERERAAATAVRVEKPTLPPSSPKLEDVSALVEKADTTRDLADGLVKRSDVERPVATSEMMLKAVGAATANQEKVRVASHVPAGRSARRGTRVHPDVSALIYSLPENIRDLVRNEVRDMERADATALIRARYEGLLGTLDTEAYLADQKAKKAAAANGRLGGAKTTMLQRMGFRPSADPAGATWKPRFTGKLNRAVYPKYGLIPPYVRPLLKLLSPAMRGAIIAWSSRADRDGTFVMPPRTLAGLIGSAKATADATTALAQKATIITLQHQGDRRQANVWRFVTVAEHDQAKAIKVLTAAKKSSSDVKARIQA